jgi:hypothetical protein
MAAKGEKRDPSSHRTPSQVRKMDRGYNATPEMKRRRAANNAARANLKKEGVNVAGKDVGHKRALDRGGSNARSNLTVQTKKENRGWRRNGKKP